MQKKKSNILLYILAVLFLIVTPTVMLYSQGYIFDVEKFRFIKTGGIFVKANPNSAQFFINNTFIKETALLNGEAYHSGLLPKEYKVKIEKPGYRLWEKTLKVDEKLVTTAKNITLLPETITFADKKSSSTISQIFVSPYNHELIALEKNAKQQFRLSTLEIENTQTKPLTQWLSSWQYEIKYLDFTFLSRNIFVALNTHLGAPSFLAINPNDDVLETPATYMKSVERFFNQNHLPTSSLKTALWFKPMFDGFLWLDTNGYMHKSGFNGQEAKIFNSEPVIIRQTQDVLAHEYFNEFILQDKRNLYYLDTQEKVFKKISSDNIGFEFSPSDPKKVLHFSSNELFVFYLAKDNDQPSRNKYDNILLDRFSGNISQAIWINNDYIAFVMDGKIKVAEIDNRDKINIYDLGQFNNPQIYFNRHNNRLYAIADGKLFESDKLID